MMVAVIQIGVQHPLQLLQELQLINRIIRELFVNELSLRDIKLTYLH